jgi:hypothetical protein
MDAPHDEDRRRRPVDSLSQAIQVPLPDGEELVPDAPADAIGRYVMLLRKWETLAARQSEYEQELARLEATGDKLRTEWDALEAERLACVEALQALPLPAEEIIRRTWCVIAGRQGLVDPPSPQSTTRPQATSSWGSREAAYQAEQQRRAQQEEIGHQRNLSWRLKIARLDEERNRQQSPLAPLPAEPPPQRRMPNE